MKPAIVFVLVTAAILLAFTQTKASPSLLAEWKFCTKNSQCANGCCSKEFSDDNKYKCTPHGEMCTGTKSGVTEASQSLDDENEDSSDDSSKDTSDDSSGDTSDDSSGDTSDDTSDDSSKDTSGSGSEDEPTTDDGSSTDTSGSGKSEDTPTTDSGSQDKPATDDGSGGTNLPSGFSGINTGIGSWFRMNNPNDETNGKSWCDYPYKDSSRGFAPDISVMTSGTDAVYPDPDWEKYGTEYCGLEAWVYSPETGKNLTLYIIDAFAHKWVKSPGSIDIGIDVYAELAGYYPTDKNIVLKGVKWAFTGRRSQKYSFGSTGDP